MIHKLKKTIKRSKGFTLKTRSGASEKSQKGFTLIELLVVIGILAVLLAIVLIAVNPPRQFILARNTQRRSDALAVLNGVGQYFAENGSLPSSIVAGSTQVIGNNTGESDLCSDLVGTTQKYLAELPVDPLPGGSFNFESDCSTLDDYSTGYSITKSSSNRITVTAPNSEDPDGGPTGPTIRVTR